MNIALWVLTVVLAVGFLIPGGAKLAGVDEIAANFERWGYPSWFMLFTGVVEVGGAILLLIPRMLPVGVVVLLATMLGATATHLRAGEVKEILAPVVLFVLLAVLGYGRRNAFKLRG